MTTELHRFLFEDLAVRGAIVRITTPWQEVLTRRAENAQTGAFPASVNALLGEMAAAAVLMQSNVKFNGALILQIMGDGPVKLAVAEATAAAGDGGLTFRCTAKVQGEVVDGSSLTELVNVNNLGRCAITLDPLDRLPGQQAYQGVVPLFGDSHESLDAISQALEHYMLQSEQLDTKLVLACDESVAAGILIQRMPREGEKNLGEREALIGASVDFQHVATLVASLKHEELLELDSMEILHRLFWNEKLLRHPPETPRFACTCSRVRVSNMLLSLGLEEVESILSERTDVEVGCDFCGENYRFDAVDAAQIFTSSAAGSPGSSQIH